MAAATRKSDHANDCPFKDYVIQRPDGAGVDPDVSSRVGNLEGGFKILTHNVEELTRNQAMIGEQMNKSVQALGGEIGELRELMGSKFEQVTTRMSEALEGVSTRVSRQAKPNMQVIITIVAMAGALAAYILNGHNAAITDNQNKIAQVQADYAKAEYSRGQADERTRQADKDATKLQQDIANGRIDLHDKIEELQSQLVDLRKWRLDHATIDSAEGAKIAARQEMIIEALRRLEQREADRLNLHEQQDIEKLHGLAPGAKK